jgi:NADH-quinone oxidoreductase subunit A
MPEVLPGSVKGRFMLTQYLPIAILIVLAAGLSGIIIVLGHLVGPRRPTERKAAPYESGMQPIGPGRRRVPVRFYRVAVLFILFDIEVIFFLPWAVVYRKLGLFGIIEMLIFIAILLVGYAYAWKTGALAWE